MSRERTTGAHLKLMCDLHAKATQVHVQHFPYTVARRYMKLDKGHSEPLEPGSKMPGVSTSAPMEIRQLLEGLATICPEDSNVIAQESVRLLFRRGSSDLNAALVVAHRIEAPPGAAEGELGLLRAAPCGICVTCDFVEDGALSTKGTARVLTRRRVDGRENALLVDVICSDRGGAGRAILGDLLCKMAMKRGRERKDLLVAVVISDPAARLFRSFGADEAKLKGGDLLMWIPIDDSLEERLEKGLRFGNSDQMQALCYRKGLTRGSRNKTYQNGC